MQIANVTVVVDPSHKLPKRGVTPGEALILAALHRKGSNGTPLEDLVVQPGDAVTIDIPAKPAHAAFYDPHAGRNIAAVEAKPAVTHKRTQAEEIERLRRFYHGQVDGKPAFEAVFGSQARIVLPETFEEISAELGIEPKSETLPGNVLNNNGPTFEEYVAAGYAPESYPPTGYLAKPSPGWTQEIERRKGGAKSPTVEDTQNGPGETAPEVGGKEPTSETEPIVPPQAQANRPRGAGSGRQQRNP